MLWPLYGAAWGNVMLMLLEITFGMTVDTKYFMSRPCTVGCDPRKCVSCNIGRTFQQLLGVYCFSAKWHGAACQPRECQPTDERHAPCPVANP
eukprot:4275175-Amphidinium_carterae.1